MVKVHVRVPGVDGVVSTELASGEAALFGRFPAVSRLMLDLPVTTVVPVTIASPHISANHVVVWSDGDQVLARDLVSRNGSWLKLPSRAVVSVPGHEVSLDLAVSTEAPTATRQLQTDPGWHSVEDFGGAVTEAVSQWLGEVGLDCHVTRATVEGDSFRRFPLADGGTLTIAARSALTLDLRLPTALDEVAAYIDEQNALLDQELGHDPEFVLRSPRFREAHRRVFDAATRGRRLLLLGASGTGKERLAECYHHHSARRDGPFKAVNCAQMEKELLWVQLFGATRGSFTGSVKEIIGAVRSADGGTLFLDEVAELSPPIQAALLRFLDRKGEYEALGDPRTRRADIQIVCATNANLRDAVARGTFREDLWYRFAGTVVHVPSLHDRPEDIVGFLDMRIASDGITLRSALTPESLQAVLAHPWPGNFRELENFIGRLPSVRRPGSISLAVCREALAEGAAHPEAIPSPASPPAQHGLESTAWNDATRRASEAWREDHDGSTPFSLGDLKEWLDAYLKPVLAANAAGIDRDITLAASINYSALGRQLDVSDGTTVKRWIERYLTRFAVRR